MIDVRCWNSIVRIHRMFMFGRHFNSLSREGRLAHLFALVLRGNVGQANVPMRGGHYSVRAALCITFVFAQWWAFEAATVRVGKR